MSIKATFPYNWKVAGYLLADDATKATTLHTIVLSAYGSEAIYGDPDNGTERIDPITLWGALEEDFSVTLSERAENKLNALMLAVESHGFYEDPDVFCAVCNALLDGEMGDSVEDTFDPVNVPEMLWAIYEVGLNRDDAPEFSKAVVGEIHRIINGEAEETNTEAKTVVDVAPYFDKMLMDEKLDLVEQLHQLGVRKELLQAILNETEKSIS